jgi:4-alpha-glucanotransferase
MKNRAAGILLHPTSLPSSSVIGNLGTDAFHFIDFIADCGFKVWQVLPVNPAHSDNSPYQALSVHAGNPFLISLDLLIKWGWLESYELHEELDVFKTSHIKALKQSFEIFNKEAEEQHKAEFEEFKTQHSSWLDGYALYIALKDENNGMAWWDWPVEERDCLEDAIRQAKSRLQQSIEETQYQQFIFFKQWLAVKQYANDHDVEIFGDMPIFVAHDSADVWSFRECFRLNEDGHTTVVAGVPPDYFSETGQRWGNPLYDWEYMKKDGFHWWIDRMKTQLILYDLIRIDHFRGFEAFWEIPAESETAIDGQWVKAPGDGFFTTLKGVFEDLPLLVEDLGVITQEVIDLRDKFNFPGMKILQFAFGGEADNPYLPHNHEKNSVVYTGTHDNDTTLGWYQSSSEEVKKHVYDYLVCETEKMPWVLIKAAMASPAFLSIIPMQDILDLGSEHRMNIPGTTENNWCWKFNWDQVSVVLPKKIKRLIELYGRA